MHGLPIGPEVSAVIGNFFLRPADRSLEANGYEHLRWCDDILIFGRTITSCQSSIFVLDEILAKLRLTRSVQKTLPFDNIASLADCLRVDEYMGMEAIRPAYDSQIRDNPEVEKRLFHWVIGTLKNKRDPYGCLSLACDPSLMNVDPSCQAST